MTKKRFIIDDDGIVTDMIDLSMYIDNDDCCEKLNELSEENEQLKIRFREERDTAMKLGSECDNLTIKNQKLELEILRLKQVLGNILLEIKKDITNTNCTGEIKVFINPDSFNLISDVLRKYGALKEWYE